MNVNRQGRYARRGVGPIVIGWAAIRRWNIGVRTGQKGVPVSRRRRGRVRTGQKRVPVSEGLCGRVRRMTRP